jgi:hypothetical protein
MFAFLHHFADDGREGIIFLASHQSVLGCLCFTCAKLLMQFHCMLLELDDSLSLGQQLISNRGSYQMKFLMHGLNVLVELPAFLPLICKFFDFRFGFNSALLLNGESSFHRHTSSLGPTKKLGLKLLGECIGINMCSWSLSEDL